MYIDRLDNRKSGGNGNDGNAGHDGNAATNKWSKQGAHGCRNTSENTNADGTNDKCTVGEILMNTFVFSIADFTLLHSVDVTRCKSFFELLNIHIDLYLVFRCSKAFKREDDFG